MSEMSLLYKEQKTTYQTIFYKNYCQIDEKPNDNDLFGYSQPEIGELPTSTNQGVFFIDKKTHDEPDFVANYGNPLANPWMRRKTIVIEENENKIALKIYSYFTERVVGKKFFRVRKNLTYLTFNFKRKLFFYGEIGTKKKKKIKQVMRVNAPDLRVTNLISKLNLTEHYTPYKHENGDHIIEKFLNRIIEKTEADVKINQKFFKKYYELILKFQKIKYPDAFGKFLGIYQPAKEIRKYGSNIVTYYMQKLGLKGKKTKLLLNKYENIDIAAISTIQQHFGIESFNRINETSFLTKQNIILTDYATSYYYYSPPQFKVSKNEIDNIINIINTSTTEECLSIILEHIRFQHELKKYGENLKIRSNTFEKFVVEHADVSALLQSYKSGYVERFYGNESNRVEENIYTDDHTYFPVLLTNTTNYEEESAHQSNCVRTYIEKPYCFIISLRKGGINGAERATIEYSFSPNEVQRIQSRGKYNSILSDEWSTPLSALDRYVNFLYKNGVITLPNMTKKFKNGKVFKTVAKFKKEEDINGGIKINMFPEWDENINSDYSDTYVFYDEDILP